MSVCETCVFVLLSYGRVHKVCGRYGRQVLAELQWVPCVTHQPVWSGLGWRCFLRP